MVSICLFGSIKFSMKNHVYMINVSWEKIVEMLAELSRREKTANIKPDPDIDVFMKVIIFFCVELLK